MQGNGQTQLFEWYIVGCIDGIPIYVFLCIVMMAKSGDILILLTLKILRTGKLEKRVGKI
jgi:hypothetical protein